MGQSRQAGSRNHAQLEQDGHVTVTVLQLSDIHFTKDAGGTIGGHEPDSRLATVLAAWIASDEVADLVLLSGDNTDTGSPEAYGRLAISLGVLGTSIIAIPGNHDNPDENAKAFGGVTTAELGGWRIVGVDSTRPHEVHGTVDVSALTEWLDALDDRPTMVVIHHPPISRSTNEYFRLKGAPQLLEALAVRPHVRAILSGHLHDAFDFETADGLALLGCPSTLMAIGHDGDEYTVGVRSTTGARVLHLEDDGTFSSTLLVA